MALVHAAIGLGEALITGMVVRFVLLTRPDLIHEADPAVAGSRSRRWGQIVVAGLGIALAVAVFLAPFASSRPDGLEFVGGRLGFVNEDAPSVVKAPFPDYEIACRASRGTSGWRRPWRGWSGRWRSSGSGWDWRGSSRGRCPGRPSRRGSARMRLESLEAQAGATARCIGSTRG